MMRKQEDVEALSSAVSRVKLRAEVANPVLDSLGSTPLSESKRLEDIVSRPEVSLSDFIQFVPRGTYSEDVVAAVEIGIKYSGYIEREKAQADKNRRLEYIRIPSDFDFDSLQGLSIECRQKLKRYKPETIAQASRISGVSPSDISVLLVYFGR
jgi:tRNA uridine 5-carboxymethylaminomethyl modification enzyme